MPDNLEPKNNEVFIGHSCIEVPLNRILLIRKDSNYFAVKFIRVWTDKDEKEKYAAYEVYFQGDGSGDFSKKNITKTEEKASQLPLKGPFRPFIYQPGNSYIKCGPFKLVWEFKKRVCFSPPDKGKGEFGFELAPTPWTEISQVNVLDLRVRWYKYDENRKRVFMPIDRLWEDMGK